MKVYTLNQHSKLLLVLTLLAISGISTSPGLASATTPSDSSITEDIDSKISDLRQEIKQIEEELNRLKAEQESQRSKLEEEQKDDDFKSFEFHGYSRAGFGWNQDGGTGNKYRWDYGASGLDEHYWRLGNEPKDHYTALQLIKNFKTDDESFAKFNATLIVAPRGEDNFEQTELVVRQLYSELGSFSWAPGVTFWAGQKWYRHPGDQHITDWQFLDISGYGGGVGDIPISQSAKLSVALLGFIDENDYERVSGGTTEITDNGEPASYVVDFRVEEIPFSMGNILLQFAPTWTRGGEFSEPVLADDGSSITELDAESGWMTAFYLNFNDFFGLLEGGSGRIIGRYGRGYGSTLFNNRYMQPNPYTTAIDWGNSSRWSLMLDGVMEITPRLQIMPVIAYQQFDTGLDTNNSITKILYGGRAKYGINENFALQLEAGGVYLDSEPTMTSTGHLKDTLYKVTFAPTIQPELGFWVRPEVRFFMTYAWWDDKESNAFLEDLDGIDPDDTSGFTYGLQMEVWF
ncbi:MAG: carbohydrate porin [Candidatus Thiodiazotropha taylori]|nr:carbohydrate porin [Candidatus Thiodiazotropha taylori]